MEPVDFLASLPHYAAHLIPIWRTLPDELRGSWWTPPHVATQLECDGIPPRMIRRGRPRTTNRITVVASYGDLRTSGQRRVVLVNHGAGQCYDGDPRSVRNPAYSGGTHRERVILFVCPSETDARTNLFAYPDADAVAAGVPYLDPWHTRPPRARGELPTVAVSFHWPCRICPEANWAWPHWRHAVARLAQRRDLHLLGHAHPRIWPTLRRWWESIGVEPVESWFEILDRADLYAADNSSTIFEFASTGRPVLLLNAPWYRRDVEHGGRFWEWAEIGIQADEPDQLPTALEDALADSPQRRVIRERLVDHIYGQCDGRAAERAAAAIVRAAQRAQEEPDAQPEGAPHPPRPRADATNRGPRLSGRTSARSGSILRRD